MAYKHIDAHFGESVTVEGIADAIVTMRWADLEEFAQGLRDTIDGRVDEDIKQNPPETCTASLLQMWAGYYLEGIQEGDSEEAKE